MTKVDEMLEKLRASRGKIQEQLMSVTEEQMLNPVQTRQTQANVRYMFYRLIAHEVEHTVHLAKTLDALGITQSEAQRILHNLQTSRGELEGMLVGLSDEDMDRIPAEGEWPPSQVLEHIIYTEELYANRIREGLQQGVQ